MFWYASQYLFLEFQVSIRYNDYTQNKYHILIININQKQRKVKV